MSFTAPSPVPQLPVLRDVQHPPLPTSSAFFFFAGVVASLPASPAATLPAEEEDGSATEAAAGDGTTMPGLLLLVVPGPAGLGGLGGCLNLSRADSGPPPFTPPLPAPGPPHRCMDPTRARLWVGGPLLLAVAAADCCPSSVSRAASLARMLEAAAQSAPQFARYSAMAVIHTHRTGESTLGGGSVVGGSMARSTVRLRSGCTATATAATSPYSIHDEKRG